MILHSLVQIYAGNTDKKIGVTLDSISQSMDISNIKKLVD